MKKLICLFALIITFSGTYNFTIQAQGLGVNSTGNPPDPSAGLDVDFTRSHLKNTLKELLYKQAGQNPDNFLCSNHSEQRIF